MGERLRERDDRGLTLIELLVSMIIFSVVIAVVMSAVITLVGLTQGVSSRADAQSEIRLGLSDIAKEMRSGNVLFSPKDEPAHVGSCKADASGADRGSCMRIFTQTNGTPRCVQWQVFGTLGDEGGSILRTRSWTPANPAGVTAWRTVARGLTLNATALPFTLNAAGAYDRRLLDIMLVAEDQHEDEDVVIETSVSGRNTSYGYDTGQCGNVPAG